MSKRILLTGVGGFIGSHVLEHILVNTDWHIVGIASWKHKGSPDRVIDSVHYQSNKHRVEIITHDLVSPFTTETISRIGYIDYVVNIASESHVDRSISDPAGFIKNNIDLTLTMLELTRQIKPKTFIQFSTDEVYGVAPKGTDHKEWSSILPSNPYAASKAAQEAIAISYWRTYGVPVVITNTMNVFGERQDKEKFIPLVMDKILKDEMITIHSYPDKKTASSRFYIHARNVADALLHILKIEPKLYPADRPDRYNIVGEKEIDNLDLVRTIANILGKDNFKYELVDFHSSRPGHDTRYALDGNKLKDSGWSQPIGFEQSLINTISWTLNQ